MVLVWFVTVNAAASVTTANFQVIVMYVCVSFLCLWPSLCQCYCCCFTLLASISESVMVLWLVAFQCVYFTFEQWSKHIEVH